LPWVPSLDMIEHFSSWLMAVPLPPSSRFVPQGMQETLSCYPSQEQSVSCRVCRHHKLTTRGVCRTDQHEAPCCPYLRVLRQRLAIRTPVCWSPLPPQQVSPLHPLNLITTDDRYWLPHHEHILDCADTPDGTAIKASKGVYTAKDTQRDQREVLLT
jgi:diadenosine tetraphosphatase ApaH/serine/threonine PP2A family protein phosphatase